MLTLTRSANGAKLSKLSEHTVAALRLYIIIFLVLFISLVNQSLVHFIYIVLFTFSVTVLLNVNYSYQVRYQVCQNSLQGSLQVHQRFSSTGLILNLPTQLLNMILQAAKVRLHLHR